MAAKIGMLGEVNRKYLKGDKVADLIIKLASEEIGRVL